MSITIVASDKKFGKNFANWQFTVDDVFSLIGPGVYVFHDHGGAALYVGSSIRVISRCMGMHHREDIRARANTIRIYPCAHERQARLLEIKLIDELKPPFNKVIPTYFAKDVV